jgi:phosphoribosylformimino-5-aminoimidazole carboxamide ribotide isomerase
MAGNPRHLDLIGRICRVVSIPVQVGGGLRTMEDLHAVFQAGAARAVLGTAAVTGDLLSQAIVAYGDRLAVALDARRGEIMVDGWREASGLSMIEIAKSHAQIGIARFIYTDVTRDGMLAGPHLAGLASLTGAVRAPVILSGGVATLDDLRAAAAAGAEGAIVGRALYDGRLSLGDALAVAEAFGQARTAPEPH